MNQRLSPAYLHAFHFVQEFLIFLFGYISLFLVGRLAWLLHYYRLDGHDRWFDDFSFFFSGFIFQGRRS